MIYVLLGILVLVLGLNWPMMAIGLQSITPLWMSVFRVAGGLTVVVAVAAGAGKLTVPPRRDVPMILSLGVFRLALVFVLVFTALQLVPPGRSSVIVWTASLWTVPIAASFLRERMNWQRWSGWGSDSSES